MPFHKTDPVFGRDLSFFVFRLPFLSFLADWLFVMLLVALLLFGFTVSAEWLGERLPFLRESKTPLRAVALGGVVLAFVGLIPWIGTLVLVLAALVSTGATLLSRFGRRVEVVV